MGWRHSRCLVVGRRRIFDLFIHHLLSRADDQALKVKNQQSTQFKPGQTYTAMTYNIGYGSYPPSYSFFMDGGKYSRAYSKKSVRTSINGVIKTTQAQNPDVAFYQEIDPDGDRSQHVNEVKMVTGAQQQ